MKIQDGVIKIKTLARWAILIALIRAAVDVVEEAVKGRPAAAPIAWPEAVLNTAIAMVIVFVVLWAAGMLSDLNLFADNSQEGDNQ